MQAIALDPLTSAVCTLKEIREMVTEMLDAEREWLPQFGNRRSAPTPTIHIPQDVKRVEVPIDPALADIRPVRRAGAVADPGGRACPAPMSGTPQAEIGFICKGWKY